MRSGHLASVCLAGMALAVSASPARAHGGRPQTQAIHVAPDDPSHLVVAATFGLLSSRDGGRTWAWTCQESIPSAVSGATAPGTLAAGDRLVLGGNAGLVRGTAAGCGWDVEPTSASHYVADVVRTADGRLLAVTGDSAAENRLLESRDEGETWALVGAPLPRRFLTERLRVAASDPRVLYVSGQTYVEGSTSVEGAVMRSADGGATWTRGAVPVAPMERLVRLVGVDEADPDALWLVIQGPMADRLLRSADGGVTWAEAAHLLADAAPQLRPFGWALGPDGTAWFGNTRAGLWAIRPDGEVALVDKFLAVACLLRRDESMWVCADGLDDGFAVATFPGLGEYAPTPVLRFADVTERACGTSVDCVCTPWWDDFLREIGRGAEVPDGGLDAACEVPDAGALDAGDAGGAPSGATCGCRAAVRGGSGRGAGAVVLVALGLVCGRRRR